MWVRRTFQGREKPIWETKRRLGSIKLLQKATKDSLIPDEPTHRITMMMAPSMCLTESHDDDSLTIVCPQNIYKLNVRGRIVSFRKHPFERHVVNQKMAQFRTHYLKKERS
jgi:hypothetical protein